MEVRFAGLPGDAVWKMADLLQAALDAHPAAVGPMIVADGSTGELTLSFEFAAVGSLGVDVPRAMEIIGEATGWAVEDAHVLGVALGWSSAPADTPELAFA